MGNFFYGLLGAADTTLTNATSSIQTYFSDNIGTIVGVVVGIALVIWLLRMVFSSSGIRKPKSIT